MSADEIDLEAIGRAEHLSQARGLRDRLASVLLDYLHAGESLDSEYAEWIDHVCRRSVCCQMSLRLLERLIDRDPYWEEVLEVFNAACRRVELLEMNEYQRRLNPPPVQFCSVANYDNEPGASAKGVELSAAV